MTSDHNKIMSQETLLLRYTCSTTGLGCLGTESWQSISSKETIQIIPQHKLPKLRHMDDVGISRRRSRQLHTRRGNPQPLLPAGKPFLLQPPFLSLFTNLDTNSHVRFLHQRTEIVDDASWIMGFLDIIDPAVDSIKRLLNLEKGDTTAEERIAREQFGGVSADNGEGNAAGSGSGFDLDEFVRQKLSLDPSNLEVRFAPSSWSKSSASATKVRRSESNNATVVAKE